MPWGWSSPTPTTKPLRRSNFLRRVFSPLLKKAGLRRIRFHDLPHTAAKLRLQQGINPRVVQELLGHSRVTVPLIPIRTFCLCCGKNPPPRSTRAPDMSADL